MAKKKINTLTCTWAGSYGAVLQAYALVKCLRNDDYDTKALNYKPSWLKKIVYNSVVKKLMLPVMVLKDAYFMRPFAVFLREEGIITDGVYKSNEELTDAELDAYAFIVGSDQVWNCTKYYNGKDDAMFLDFAVKGQKKISYAASLAMPKVPKDQERRYRDKLSSFDAISVREKTGERALRDIGVDDVETVIDPVYLVDRKKWSELAKKSHIDICNEKYLLVVCLEDRPGVYEYAAKQASRMGVRIYSISSGIRGWKKRSVVDKNFWNISVYDYLRLVEGAERVVADSFHAMSFSLIFNREFDVVPRNDKGNSRMSDLLVSIGIPERIIDKNKILEDGIDYEEVNKKIAFVVERSKKFLMDALKEEKQRK